MNYHLNLSVLINTATWGRESHGLFDYESSQVAKKTLKVTASGKLVRIKNDILWITENPNNREYLENTHPLAFIKYTEGSFFFKIGNFFFFIDTFSNVPGHFSIMKHDSHGNKSQSHHHDHLWLVVKCI